MSQVPVPSAPAAVSRRKGIEFGGRQIAIIVLSTALDAIMNWFSAAFQVVPGASLIFPATAIAVTFSLWFGVWGALGAYFGTILGGFAWGTTILVSATGGIHDMIEGLIPLLVFHLFGFHPSLKRFRDLAGFIVFGVVLNTFTNALLGNLNYVLWGTQPLSAVWVGVWPWWLGDMVAAAVLAIPLLRFLTPYVMRTGLYHEGMLRRRV